MTKYWTDDLEYINYVLGRALAGRRELLEDFKGAAIFLASRASDIVTGVSLVLDGGLIAKREPIKTHGYPYTIEAYLEDISPRLIIQSDGANSTILKCINI
jgi:hypothetical protein